MDGLTFADRLRRLVRRKYQSWPAAAHGTGLPERRIARLCQGESLRGPTLEEVELLAAVLGTTPARLAGWSR